MISLTKLLTFDLTKNPAPAPTPTPPIKRVPNWQHARTYASTHAKLRAETYGGEGRA